MIVWSRINLNENWTSRRFSTPIIGYFSSIISRSRTRWQPIGFERYCGWAGLCCFNHSVYHEPFQSLSKSFHWKKLGAIKLIYKSDDSSFETFFRYKLIELRWNTTSTFGKLKKWRKNRSYPAKEWNSCVHEKVGSNWTEKKLWICWQLNRTGSCELRCP